MVQHKINYTRVQATSISIIELEGYQAESDTRPLTDLTWARTSPVAGQTL